MLSLHLLGITEPCVLMGSFLPWELPRGNWRTEQGVAIGKLVGKFAKIIQLEIMITLWNSGTSLVGGGKSNGTVGELRNLMVKLSNLEGIALTL